MPRNTAPLARGGHYTAPMAVSSAFADFCCELLASLGPLRARRMFGGWGLSVDGLTVAIVADLGQGDRLWRAVYYRTTCYWGQ
jgi:hypothetical protein